MEAVEIQSLPGKGALARCTKKKGGHLKPCHLNDSKSLNKRMPESELAHDSVKFSNTYPSGNIVKMILNLVLYKHYYPPVCYHLFE
jgi:hypothetical protein